MGIPVGFCAPWIDADRLCCPDAPDGEDCATGDPIVTTYAWSDDELIVAATGILFRATCQLYPGLCDVTVRPCAHCNCGRNKCGCGRYFYITLQDSYPVTEINEVKIDGNVVDSSTYRIDDFKQLVRLDGQCWPTCNDLSLDSTEPQTFDVSYTAGREPPIELQMACAELACEMKRACNGQSCGLPRNVTSVSRQGVSMNIDALESAVNGAVTGLAVVDNVVRQYNCQRQRSRVWHPSLDKPRQVFPS